MVWVKVDWFHDLCGEFLESKGVPGMPTGGPPDFQSGIPRWPGGKCFAPFQWSTMCVSTAKLLEKRHFWRRKGRLDGKSCEIPHHENHDFSLIMKVHGDPWETSGILPRVLKWCFVTLRHSMDWLWWHFCRRTIFRPRNAPKSAGGWIVPV